MYSTLLWYFDNSEKYSGKSVDGICAEYVKQDGRLYAGWLAVSEPPRYLDSRFVPGRNPGTDE